MSKTDFAVSEELWLENCRLKRHLGASINKRGTSMINNIEFLLQMKLTIIERIHAERRHIEESQFTKFLANMQRANALGGIKVIEHNRSLLQGQSFLMVQKGWTIGEIEALTVGHLVSEVDYLSLRTKLLAKDNKSDKTVWKGFIELTK